MSMELFRQKCQSGLLFLPAGNLSDPGTEPESPVLAGGFFTTETPRNDKFIRVKTFPPEHTV